MNSKNMPKSQENTVFDSLSMYHHRANFDHRLKELLSILELPKETELKERFKKLEEILDTTFRLEIIHHLELINKDFLEDEKEHPHAHPHPQILLHLWCLLSCTNSLESIAQYLELSIEEVNELIRELHNTFSIDSLVSRVYEYYKQNKRILEFPELQKKAELLGIDHTLEPKDVTEERKQRLRRRYGHLGKVFDLMSHTL